MGEEREQRLFPDKDHSDQRITCHDITSDFLIYGTDVSSERTLYLGCCPDPNIGRDLRLTSLLCF